MTLKSNAEGLVLISQDKGADVTCAPVRYPSEMGDIAGGAVDIGEYLHELKGQDVVLVVAPLGPVEELPIICGLCGTPYSDDECPTCRTEQEDAKRVIEERLRRDREQADGLTRDLEGRLNAESEE